MAEFLVEYINRQLPAAWHLYRVREKYQCTLKRYFYLLIFWSKKTVKGMIIKRTFLAVYSHRTNSPLLNIMREKKKLLTQ